MKNPRNQIRFFSGATDGRGIDSTQTKGCFWNDESIQHWIVMVTQL